MLSVHSSSDQPIPPLEVAPQQPTNMPGNDGPVVGPYMVAPTFLDNDAFDNDVVGRGDADHGGTGLVGTGRRDADPGDTGLVGTGLVGTGRGDAGHGGTGCRDTGRGGMDCGGTLEVQVT